MAKRTEKKKITKDVLYRSLLVCGGYALERAHIDFCSKAWHRITGIKLKRGESKQVKITQLKKGFKFEVR